MYAYALLEPDTAGRVRQEFGDVLDSPPGRMAQLVVAAELLPSTTHGDYPELAGSLRALVAQVAP